ncbi:hypothetical protein [Kitasatospora cystarginea]|uniref:hypothetical protein n=1 Tax=Kitasatospora cystarginea TaxID=58350 RepID=UPI0031D4641D
MIGVDSSPAFGAGLKSLLGVIVQRLKSDRGIRPARTHSPTGTRPRRTSGVNLTQIISTTWWVQNVTVNGNCTTIYDNWVNTGAPCS